MNWGKRKNILCPSILAADFTQLGNDIKKAENAGADMLHIDVMDGAFVPSISFGMPVISSIRKITDMPFDVHLMVYEPGRYIEEFAKCGADNITVHAECCTHLNRVLKEIKDLGLSASVALNPATPLNVLDYVMNYIDMVLIMTVNPGFGGQAYIEESTEKIRSLKDKIQSGGRNIRIEVDGGINDETLPIVLDAGANVIVAGTSIFKGNIEENVLKFQSVMNK